MVVSSGMRSGGGRGLEQGKWAKGTVTFQCIKSYFVSIFSIIWYLCITSIMFLEKEMAPHSSTLAWKIPWTGEPGRLQAMGLRRVGHD